MRQTFLKLIAMKQTFLKLIAMKQTDLEFTAMTHTVLQRQQKAIVNQTFQCFKRNVRELWETEWSAYGLFQVYRYHLELNTHTHTHTHSLTKCQLHFTAGRMFISCSFPQVTMHIVYPMMEHYRQMSNIGQDSTLQTQHFPNTV